MDIDIDEKLDSIQAKINLLYYALGFMHLQNIEDCTEAYLFSETLKQEFDELMANF